MYRNTKSNIGDLIYKLIILLYIMNTLNYKLKRRKLIKKLKKNINDKEEYKKIINELETLYDKYKNNRKSKEEIDNKLNTYLKNNELKPASEIRDDDMFKELLLNKIIELQNDIKSIKKNQRGIIEIEVCKRIKNLKSQMGVNINQLPKRNHKVIIKK